MNEWRDGSVHFLYNANIQHFKCIAEVKVHWPSRTLFFFGHYITETQVWDFYDNNIVRLSLSTQMNGSREWMNTTVKMSHYTANLSIIPAHSLNLLFCTHWSFLFPSSGLLSFINGQTVFVWGFYARNSFGSLKESVVGSWCRLK